MRLSNAVQNALLIRAAHSMQSDWAYIHSPLATPPSTGEHICQQFRLLMSFITKLYRQTNDIRLYTIEGTYGRRVRVGVTAASSCGRSEGVVSGRLNR